MDAPSFNATPEIVPRTDIYFVVKVLYFYPGFDRDVAEILIKD